MTLETTARLLITCPDRPGIVAAVTGFLYSHGANITTLAQHSTDPEGGNFFMRLEFQTPHLDLGKEALEQAFESVVASRFNMNWNIFYAAHPKKVAFFVSKHDHCLLELLWRWSRGELHCDVGAVISNHPDLEKAVKSFGVPFHHVSITKETKPEAEKAALDLAKDCDLMVLARYMQILTGEFISGFGKPIINIHHSFLPAFIGANPYKQAHERGVKIIGATAHYVTEELDAGPIIEQSVARVDHTLSVEELKLRGSELERQVLANAVRWHLDDKVIVHDNKTVVL